jgi:hypothetical protein
VAALLARWLFLNRECYILKLEIRLIKMASLGWLAFALAVISWVNSVAARF